MITWPTAFSLIERNTAILFDVDILGEGSTHTTFLPQQWASIPRQSLHVARVWAGGDSTASQRVGGRRDHHQTVRGSRDLATGELIIPSKCCNAVAVSENRLITRNIGK